MDIGMLRFRLLVMDKEMCGISGKGNAVFSADSRRLLNLLQVRATNRELVAEVINAALRMAKKVNYSSLGTFEFLVRSSPPEFYFLEVNPRLQVEHTITESIAMGIDLVKMQHLLAQGQSLSSLSFSNLTENPETPPPLHSLQLRVTAEDVSNDWSLSVGKINSFRFPAWKWSKG